MTQHKKGNQLKYNIIIYALAFLLILLGGIMAIYTYKAGSEGLLEYQDKQLYRMSNAADRTLKAIIEDAEGSIEDIAGSKRVTRACRQWENTGSDYELYSILNRKVFAQNDLCQTILVEKNNKIIYSLDGDIDYKFKDKKVEEHIRICQNLNGNLFLAVDSIGRNNVRYTALLDLRRIYLQLAGSDTGANFGLILLDKSGQVVMYPDGSNAMAKSIEHIEKPVLLEGIKFLERSQATGKNTVDSYQQESKKRTYRIDTLLANNNSNGVFSIASVINYEPIMRLTQKTNVKLFAFYLMMILGIGLLVTRLIETRRRNIKALEELEVLKEKNRIMQELQEKAENLAHMQRLETIGTLTSSIAHEFNNLLTPIMGYSLMTLEKLPPEEVEMYDNILEIYNASSKAKEIISRLSKLSRKNTDGKHDVMNPDVVLNKAMNVTTPALPKNVDVIRKLNCQDVKISGNEVQLSQLFLNLIINAFQAMGENGGILTLETKLVKNARGGELKSDAKGEAKHENCEKGKKGAKGKAETKDDAVRGEVIISVTDTGCGMDEETQAKIFDPFFTTKVSGEGTGLGLAIALQSVEDHGGYIDVDSKLGEGTTFNVHIPQWIDEDVGEGIGKDIGDYDEDIEYNEEEKRR